MTVPKVSVIIPTYNHADYLAETIQSVLCQTYQNYELVVVDDASRDQTVQIINQFDDPRIKYIAHTKNRGPAATRNTGIQAASGEFIAFLDADDLFHPEKLEAHVAFRNKHPEVDVTYNSRFELNYSSKSIRGIVRPPLAVTLSDLVVGFPFTTSDMVLRREKLFQAGLFEESFVWSEELELNCKLAFIGCQFASVDRALNYRRFESGRRFKNLAAKCESAIQALEKIFADSRCPTGVLGLRPRAFANIYLDYGYLALEQDEILFGQELVRNALGLNQSLIMGEPCRLVISLLKNSIVDESLSHEIVLQTMLARLPREVMYLSKHYDWAVAQGYILKGIRAVIWNRLQDATTYFSQATQRKARLADIFLNELIYQLLSFEKEFGPESVDRVFRNLAPHLIKLSNRRSVSKLIGGYFVNRAFQAYRVGAYSQVPKIVIKALTNDPKYLINRGVMAILLRSTIRNRTKIEAQECQA